VNLPPWVALLLTLVSLGGYYGVIIALRSKYNLSPELGRKLIHVGMGAVTVWFPWLFRDIWPVALLTGVAVFSLLVVRIFGKNSEAGAVLHSVQRYSGGDLYFPIAVLITFAVAHKEPAFYVIPILVLSLADAGAALVGVRYGQAVYVGADGKKSVEGSFVFFSLAFFAAHLPLLLMTDVGRVESVLIALTLSLLVTLFEAIAWRGLDNLFVPLGSLVLLRIYRELPVESLVLRLAALSLIAIFVIFWHKRTTLQAGALLTAGLVGYASWALGGLDWLLAPLLLFVSYTLLWPQSAARPRDHTVEAVLSVTGAGMAWLIAGRLLGREDFIVPYYMTFCAALTFIGIAWFRDLRPFVTRPSIYFASVGKAFLVMGLPLVLLIPVNNFTVALVTGLTGIAAAFLYDLFIPVRSDYTVSTFPWRRQRIIAGFVSLLGYFVLFGVSVFRELI
jgi:phytol kinase